MRLAVCTLSAVLLSGCSWLGFGGHQSGYAGNAACMSGGAYGAQGQYGAAQGFQGYNAGAGCAGGYGAANSAYGSAYGNGFGAGAYGGQGYGQGAGAYGGLRGAQSGANGYGVASGPYGQNGQVLGGGGYTGGQVVGQMAGGQGGVVTSGQYGGAQYAGGQVVGGQMSGGQWVNGQWVSGSTGQYASNAYGSQVYGGQYGANSTVTTVQGAPVYVQQPYPAYYPVGVAAGGLRGGFAALPFGIEAGIGSDFGIGGDIIGAKPAGAALGSATRALTASPAIGYKDAYKNAVNYDLAATYDLDPSTTAIARIGYSKAEGERVQMANVTDTTFPGVNEPYYATWGDLEQVTLEGGVRKYMGGWGNPVRGIRPYVQATGGFAHNNAVNVTQESATIINPAETQPYIRSGWKPTASAAVGAEMQMGPRSAIGVEAGVRWRDNLDTVVKSGDRWSVPVRLRGRVSF